MPRYDVPKAAPEPLRLVQLFVNTVDRERGREWIGSVRELRAWLRERGLPVRGIDAEALERAHELREALRELLLANNGAPWDRRALDLVGCASVGVRLTAPAEIALRGAAPLDEIVAVAYGAMLDGSWQRLKACRNCRWAFYDYSRNQSAGWCSMLICGNRAKTRAYRRRRTTA
jgi:predicted RNA-binding Zn ribbon-like protein